MAKFGLVSFASDYLVSLFAPVFCLPDTLLILPWILNRFPRYQSWFSRKVAVNCDDQAEADILYNRIDRSTCAPNSNVLRLNFCKHSCVGPGTLIWIRSGRTIKRFRHCCQAEGAFTPVLLLSYLVWAATRNPNSTWYHFRSLQRLPLNKNSMPHLSNEMPDYTISCTEWARRLSDHVSACTQNRCSIWLFMGFLSDNRLYRHQYLLCRSVTSTLQMNQLYQRLFCEQLSLAGHTATIPQMSATLRSILSWSAPSVCWHDVDSILTTESAFDHVSGLLTRPRQAQGGYPSNLKTVVAALKFKRSA